MCRVATIALREINRGGTRPVAFGYLLAGPSAQASGRGLAPRLSSGTLQLSIRCSSIHLLLSRSFPVDGAVAAPTASGAAARSSDGARRSCAADGDKPSIA